MIRSCGIRAGAVCAAFILAALFVPAAGAPSPAAGGINQMESAVIDAYAEGNYRVCYERLEAMLAAYPAHPVSALYYDFLFSFADLVGPAAVEASAGKIRNAILASGDENAPAALIRLDCQIEKNRYRIDGEKAKQVTDELKPVRRWMLFGPYRRFGPGDIDRPFQPEIETHIVRVTPQKKTVVTNYDGWLDPGRYLADARGVVYAAVSFYAESAIRIRVCSETVYKGFINGKLVLANPQGDCRRVRVVRVPRAGGITVMIKLQGEPAGKLRLLITDDMNRSVEPMREDDRVFTDDRGASEEPEYPGAYVMDDEKESARGDARRGLYFNGLGSDHAIACYRKSYAREKSAHVLFLLAGVLRSGDGRRKGSTRYEEAGRLLDEIAVSYPAYVPARECRLGLMVEKGDYRDAYLEGKQAVSSSPLDAYSCLTYLGVLDFLGRDREFEDAALLIRKEFPDSPLLEQREADFFSKKNPPARCAALAALLKRSFSPESARSLLREYLARGDYNSARELINSYNFNNDFTRELIELLVRKGDFDEARTVIFKSLVSSDNPDLYHSLAMIDVARSDDPSMYLQKLLVANPSDFGAGDYLGYVTDGILVNPFDRFLDAGGAGTPRLERAQTASPAEVLFRQRVYLLNEDGGSRAFFEEIVRINSEGGARLWSSIRLPRGRGFRPVRVRVYDGSGGHVESYSVRDDLLSIGSVRKDTVLHLSYIVENVVPMASKRGLFSMPPDFMQIYDEPVGSVSVKVIAPEKLKLRFVASKGIKIEERVAGSMKQFSCPLGNLAAVSREKAAGGMLGSLPWVSFSTMDGPGDFVAWYGGLLSEADRDTDIDAGRFARDDAVRTIGAVYDFVARQIALREGGIGFPLPAGDTLFTKSGSAEDKVLLARALLGKLGIRSYTAFARSKHLPDAVTIMHHEYFTSVLLYVPLDEGSALWLDFSSPRYLCGATDEAVDGTDALVMVNDFYHMKKVVSVER